MENIVETGTGLRPGKVIAVHLSYPSRAAQRGRTPAAASYFLKPSSSLTGSGTVERPEGFELLAYEGEVALIIGTAARRVAVASLVGTTVEWYDYFIYANAAALIFGPQFFSAVPKENQLLISFATVGISFLFRPLGAAVAGHFGDRIGRKKMLLLTLLMMGGATALIGVLPPAASIGIWAPVLLVVLRVVQGFSAGGEWGGAALMAVEHSPADKRGRFGAFPQMGVPLGMLLATGFLAMLSVLLSPEAFIAWGWRIPFLSSLVLIAVGLWIRLGVEESPVFKDISAHDDEVKMPLAEVFRFNGKQVLLGALVVAGNGVAGYMATGGFILAYATTALEMSRPVILNLVTLASATWILTTGIGGLLCDHLGRVRVYQIGFVLQLLWVFPLFMLVNTRSIVWIAVALIVLTIGLGLTYGPQSALFAEMFPDRIRYSGASMAYAVGAILGGAFAPMIAQALLDSTKSTTSISAYLFGVTLLGLIATFFIKDRTGKRLDKDAMDIPGAAELEESLRARRVV
ncbi:MFS transporter [Nigerium massiliense]|uniref:MFS transporter n=1 Tax=Nigerium massiliense TaxID=1522317 RepID=UPI000B1B9382|nr:MFS transporter [Nigerium massiliense]